jgi:hypothetical protein
MRWFKLRGIIILESSPHCYHVVFDRKVLWSENMHITIIAIISGTIGAGMSYSVLNPMIVDLQNEITMVSSELATVSDELATTSDEVVTISDELDSLSNIGDLSTIVSTITDIEARTWNLVYKNSNVVNLMSPAGWFDTPTFTIQGQLMRIDWKLWCDAAGLTTYDIGFYFSNGTLVDTVGLQIDTINCAKDVDVSETFLNSFRDAAMRLSTIRTVTRVNTDPAGMFRLALLEYDRVAMLLLPVEDRTVGIALLKEHATAAFLDRVKTIIERQ